MNNLEMLLAHELRPVAAPPELWNRVEMPRVERSRVGRSSPRWTWAVAAAAVVASVWGLRPTGEIRSSDTARIRAWVRGSTGLDIPLAAKTPASSQLIRARVVREGRAAEISYKVGDYDATLLVAKAEPSQLAGHRPLGRDAKVASWVMRGQMYTLACTSPEGLQAACRLCHG